MTASPPLPGASPDPPSLGAQLHDAFVRFKDGIVAILDVAGRVFHTALYCWFREDWVAKVIKTGIYFIIFGAFYFLYTFHEKLFPEAVRQSPFYWSALRAVLSFLTVALLSVPLLLVRYHDKKRKAAARNLHYAMKHWLEILRPLAKERQVDGQLIEELIQTARSRSRELFTITPNGFFLVADRFKEPLVHAFNAQPGAADVLEAVAQGAPRFADALKQYEGDVHFMFPDLQDTMTLGQIRTREVQLNAKEGHLVTVIRTALDRAGLINAHRKGRITERYALPFFPEFRLLISGTATAARSRCYFQFTGTGGPSVLSPIYVLDGSSAPDGFTGLLAMTKSLCNML